MSNVPLPEPDISVPFLSEVRKVPQGDYYRADKVLPLLKQWPVLYEAVKAGHEQAFAEAQNAAAVSAAKDAEIERLRADFTALQRAIVGDTGASAILEAGRLRALDALKTCNSNEGDDPWYDHAKVYAARDALRAALAAPERKMAPVQGWPQGIPWSLHLEAYAAYCKKWSPQPALIDLEGRNCRGGFGTDELDEFIPGWRERASEIAQLRSELAHAAAVSAAKDAEIERLLERAKALYGGTMRQAAEIAQLRTELLVSLADNKGLRAEVAGLRAFVEHVRRNGSTHLANMAVAVLAARKGEA